MPQALERCWGHTGTSAALQQLTQAFVCVFFLLFFPLFFLSRESHNGARAGPLPHSPHRPPPPSRGGAGRRGGKEGREGAVRRARPSRERAA